MATAIDATTSSSSSSIPATALTATHLIPKSTTSNTTTTRATTRTQSAVPTKPSRSPATAPARSFTNWARPTTFAGAVLGALSSSSSQPPHRSRSVIRVLLCGTILLLCSAAIQAWDLWRVWSARGESSQIWDGPYPLEYTSLNQIRNSGLNQAWPEPSVWMLLRPWSGHIIRWCAMVVLLGFFRKIDRSGGAAVVPQPFPAGGQAVSINRREAADGAGGGGAGQQQRSTRRVGTRKSLLLRRGQRKSLISGRMSRAPSIVKLPLPQTQTLNETNHLPQPSSSSLIPAAVPPQPFRARSL